MPPGRPPSQVLAIVAGAPPAVRTIAELHASLRETESLAHRYNAPFASALYIMLFSWVTSQLPNRAVLLRALEEGAQAWLGGSVEEFWPVFLWLIPAIIVMHYRLLSLVSNIVDNIFPNGVGYDRRRHPAYEMRMRLGTQGEVVRLNGELRTLIHSQHRGIRAADVMSFLISILLPYLCSMERISTGVRFTAQRAVVSGTLFGLGVEMVSPRPLGVFTDVSRFSVRHQALQNTRLLLRAWARLRAPRQIKNFERQLQRFSDMPWRRHAEASDLWQLSFSSDMCFGADKQTITKHAYLTELHRLLLEAKIPVYRGANDELYVGFSSLSSRSVRYLHARLLNRLTYVARAEQEADKVLHQLNALMRVVGLQDACDYYFAVDAEGNPRLHYYLNTDTLLLQHADAFYDALLKFMPASCIDRQNHLIDVEHFALDAVKISEAIGFLREKTMRAVSVDSFVAAAAASVGAVKKRPVVISQLPVAAPVVDERSARIEFGNGVAFFPLAPGQSMPANYAYPLTVPWLPAGRAYASIDERVITAAAQYLTSAQILARLERGNVHGMRAQQSHTASGAIGIQSTTEGYKNIHGQVCTAALKLKFNNNIRIFGRRVGEVNERGDRHVHYRFDGVGFGH